MEIVSSGWCIPPRSPLARRFCSARCFFTRHARGSGYSVGSGCTYVSGGAQLLRPNDDHLARGHPLDSVTDSFSEELGEQGAYLGLLLILTLFMYFVQARRTAGADPARHQPGHGCAVAGREVALQGTDARRALRADSSHLAVFDEPAPARIALYLALATSVAVKGIQARRPRRSHTALMAHGCDRPLTACLQAARALGRRGCAGTSP